MRNSSPMPSVLAMPAPPHPIDEQLHPLSSSGKERVGMDLPPRCTLSSADAPPWRGVGGDLGTSWVRRFVTFGFDWTFFSQSNPHGFPFRRPRPPVSTVGSLVHLSLHPREPGRGERDPEREGEGVDYPKEECDPYGRNGHHERGMVPLEDGAGGGTAAGADRTTQRKASRRTRWTWGRFGRPLREMASVRPFGRGVVGSTPTWFDPSLAGPTRGSRPYSIGIGTNTMPRPAEDPTSTSAAAPRLERSSSSHDTPLACPSSHPAPQRIAVTSPTISSAASAPYVPSAWLAPAEARP